MFANCQLMGTDMAFPDVCLTPSPAGPVPIPYPNIAMGSMAIPNLPTILFAGAPAHNMGTTIPISNGDNPGVGTGVVSHLVMGPCRHSTGAFTVLLKGLPATRMTSVSTQNNMNAVGCRLVPSQSKILLLAA